MVAAGVGVFLNGPTAVVDLVMALAAEQYRVVRQGQTAVLPVDDVVGDAPFGFSAATDAALVPGDEHIPKLVVKGCSPPPSAEVRVKSSAIASARGCRASRCSRQGTACHAKSVALVDLWSG